MKKLNLSFNEIKEKACHISKKTMIIALAAALVLSAAAGAGVNSLLSRGARASVEASQQVKADSRQSAEKDETVYVIAKSATATPSTRTIPIRGTPRAAI